MGNTPSAGSRAPEPAPAWPNAHQWERPALQKDDDKVTVLLPKSDDHDLTEETPSTAEGPSRYMAYLARIRNVFRVSKSLRYIGYSSDISGNNAHR